MMENGSPVDISSATQKDLIFKKPPQDKFIRAADFVTDGTDGKIKYSSVAGEIDIKGTYRLQAFIKTLGGEYFTEIKTIDVAENL